MGGVAGSAAAAATTPLDVVKTRMMCSASERPTVMQVGVRRGWYRSALNLTVPYKRWPRQAHTAKMERSPYVCEEASNWTPGASPSANRRHVRMCDFRCMGGGDGGLEGCSMGEKVARSFRVSCTLGRPHVWLIGVVSEGVGRD